MGWIGSAVKLVAPKRLPGFSFFQLSWVPNIYLMYVKSITNYALTFFVYIISVLASVTDMVEILIDQGANVGIKDHEVKLLLILPKGED